MARDDYFVIAYKILIYLRACLKEGITPDIEIISPEKLKINQIYWNDIMRFLSEDGYIKGIIVVPILNNTNDIKIKDLKITPAGLQYLEENSMMSKAKEFLKELKEVIPGM